MSMTMRDSKHSNKFLRDYKRSVLRSTFRSLFWAVFSHRKTAEGTNLKEVADRLNVDKSSVSRWFSGDPNWEINTIADIAAALNVDIRVMAVDQRTGRRFAPFGEIAQTPGTGTLVQHVQGFHDQPEPGAAPTVSSANQNVIVLHEARLSA
jgi:transcriptional regulator with XRE-family HTH domain